MHAGAQRTLLALLAAAFVVSVVHYADNYLNYDAYPVPTSGPSPSAGVVLGSWFVFTAFGLAGLAYFTRGRVLAAAACLGVYSISGLVGLAHYSVPGATGMPWWRQAHIAADIACGVAVLGFAFWSVRRLRSQSDEVSPRS